MPNADKIEIHILVDSHTGKTRTTATFADGSILVSYNDSTGYDTLQIIGCAIGTLEQGVDPLRGGIPVDLQVQYTT